MVNALSIRSSLCSPHGCFPCRPRLRGRRGVAAVLVALTLGAALAGRARADHDPARTLTIYVHGFDLAGASRQGVYGDAYHEAVADSIARLAGLPVSTGGDGALPPNVVIGVGYYGDSPPAWYSAADRADVNAVSASRAHEFKPDY